MEEERRQYDEETYQKRREAEDRERARREENQHQYEESQYRERRKEEEEEYRRREEDRELRERRKKRNEEEERETLKKNAEKIRDLENDIKWFRGLSNSLIEALIRNNCTGSTDIIKCRKCGQYNRVLLVKLEDAKCAACKSKILN